MKIEMNGIIMELENCRMDYEEIASNIADFLMVQLELENHIFSQDMVNIDFELTDYNNLDKICAIDNNTFKIKILIEDTLKKCRDYLSIFRITEEDIFSYMSFGKEWKRMVNIKDILSNIEQVFEKEFKEFQKKVER